MSRADATTRWLLILIRVAALLLPALLVGCSNGSQSAGSPSSTPPSSSASASSTTPPPSSTPSSSTPSSSSTPTAPTSPATNRCRAGDLSGSIGFVSGASGKRRVDIYLRNQTDKPCTLEGYPKIDLLTSSGGVIDYPVRESLNPGGTFAHDLVIHKFTLEPEMTAYAVIFFNGAWITDKDKKTCVKWT